MEPRPRPAYTTTTRDPVLLIGPDSRMRRALARELHALRIPMAQADSLTQAIDDSALLPRSSPSVLLLPETLIQTERFEQERAELQIGIGASRLVPIAIGRKPDATRRRELRDLGIHLALFGRFGRHALRFQLNRACSPYVERGPRGATRAPMEWRTRTYSSGREKAVRCYSLSMRGAYFVTPRPWVVGTQITLDLPLTERESEVGAHILYTKSTGGADRPGLPGGMAVRFETLPTRVANAIQRNLEATRFGLEV